MTVREARAAYYESNGFSEPSTSRRWEWVKLGPIGIPILNTRARVRALECHDVHHLATGYKTDWRGEAEQSAWELGAGCHRYWFAWGINALGLAMGAVIAPVRTWRAFRRGLSCTTLYSGPFDPAVLDLSLDALRERLGIEDEVAPAVRRAAV